MMNRTTIEWVLNPDGSPGFTSNPFTGCLGPNSDGIRCSYCYAWRESFGRCKQADLRGTPIELPWNDDPFYPRFHPERLQQIKGRQKPAGIFLCDRSDFAAPYWPPEWQAQLWDMIVACPQHRFYLLTHQPQELQKFSPFPPNCWVGVTATNKLGFSKAMVSLGKIEASIKFISFEPLLERIEMWSLSEYLKETLDWLIIGAQTNPYKPPKLEWVLEIVGAADKAGAKVFLKNNLVPMIADSLDLNKLKLYPDGIHLRQEMPE